MRSVQPSSAAIEGMVQVLGPQVAGEIRRAADVELDRHGLDAKALGELLTLVGPDTAPPAEAVARPGLVDERGG